MTQNLDQAAMQALLDALGPGSADAGAAYEELRERLIRFFRWNNCLFSEDLADTALDRLAEKLAHGDEPILNPARFVAGIARMVLLEQYAQQNREKKMLSFLSWFQAIRGEQNEDRQQHEDALDSCLERMSPENRALLERYYSGDAGERIRNRQALANELGIAMNALRNRALRLRAQLEKCTARYLARSGQHDKSTENVTHRQRTVL